MDSVNQLKTRHEIQQVCGIPLSYIDEWQGFLSSLAKTLKLPSCMIMLYHDKQFLILTENLVREEMSADAAEGIPCYDGIYCKEVIKKDEPLFIQDATQDDKWRNKVNNKNQYINYLGFPLLWPDKDPFGTICVVDRHPREYKEEERKLLYHFSRIIEAHLELIFEKNNLEDSNEDLEILASTDSLTKILNRRAFEDKARSELERAARYNNSICLLMIDIDRFKDFNDQYGHAIGDKVLSLFARETSKMIRDSDVFARIGGEEFAILMPETGEDDAYLFAERLRDHVARLKSKISQHVCQFTISIGLIEVPRKTKDIQTALKEADRFLYQAKKTGRNKTCR